jgi:hypothetical protein
MPFLELLVEISTNVPSSGSSLEDDDGVSSIVERTKDSIIFVLCAILHAIVVFSFFLGVHL